MFVQFLALIILLLSFSCTEKSCSPKFDLFAGKEKTICLESLCTWPCRSRNDCSKAEICKFERGKKTGVCVWPCTNPDRPKDESFCKWECRNDVTCELERSAVVEMLNKQKKR
ncbi:MAG: hypothetical protein QGI45_17550 [Myxococcota bacterium]|jgi:hypothetical protein|nr:hypothetical protein [Myxococcota bacterium]